MATFDVLLPVRNGQPYLREALDSIVQQTFRDWRLLILDHGSTDGSLELAQSYAELDERIQLHHLPEAQGLSGLLNAGLAFSDCKYILRQDADDISLPQRMEILAQAFETDRSLVLAGSLGEVIDAQGRAIGRIDMPTGRHGIAAGTLFRTMVCHPAVAMRMESLQQLNARYGEDFIQVLPAEKQIRVPGLAEDYFLFGQLALVSACMNVRRSLIKYRWHGNNVSATRYVDQMDVALKISRYLAASLATLQNTTYVDPAPFCNHAERLFDLEQQGAWIEQYAALRTVLTRWLPPSYALQRELAFRRVIATRSRTVMASRYAAFVALHGKRPAEFNTVKSWLVHGIKRQPILTLTNTGLCA